jgi:protein-tyrosine phosphatase
MVCLGNICRSPLAEGILQSRIDELALDWEVDSAGTGGWHAGELPDSRSIREAAKNGIDIKGQRARKLRHSDFEDFDLLLTMDTENYNDVRRLAQNEAQRNKVKLIMNFAEPNKNISVPDPYYDDRFSLVFGMLVESIDALIAKYAVEKAKEM